MHKSHPPFPAEFRQQMMELVRAGRNPEQLSREFGCTAQSIRNWVAQSAIDKGKALPGIEGLTSVERDELARLRRPRDVIHDSDQGSQYTSVFPLSIASSAVSTW